jgi:hypothetical protein
MSDENQPNEVVESQLRPEGMPAESPPALTPELLESPAASPARAMQGDIPAKAETHVHGNVPADGAPASSVVSIADLETSKPSSGEKLSGVLTGVGTLFASIGALFRGRRWLLGALAALVVIVFLALLLPRLSLAQFAGAFERGYTALDAENRLVAHPDGLRISLADPVERKVRVKLESIPRAEFETGELPENLAPALTMLPSNLTPKSPYYTINLRGNDVSGPATLEVDIPNEAEPWETLDLYAWDGEAWRWLPTQLDRSVSPEVLRSNVQVLPKSVMAMQTGMAAQQIAAAVESYPLPLISPAPETALTEIVVPGILVGTMGGVTGDVTQLPAAQGGGLTLVPTVRNWVLGRDPNCLLVKDMLNNAADRTTHVQTLLNIAQNGGYGGLVLDYRSVQPEARDVFAGFVTDLGAALRQNGRWLAVMVDTPQRTPDGAWDTGGYDWAALGAAADQVRVLMPLDPGAYTPGGLAEQLIVWGVTQVNRQKLIPVYSTLSTDGAKCLTLGEILAPIGGIQAAETLTESVTPGTALTFKLGAVSAVESDVATGATRMTVGEVGYWLGTPQWLRQRMTLIERYHLGGVALDDLFAEGNMPDMLASVAEYKARTEVAAAYRMPEISWQVTGPGGQVESTMLTALTQPQFAWTAPGLTGTYMIAAHIAGLDKGALAVLVDAPKAVVTETLALTETLETGSEAATETPSDTAAANLKAAYVADVTVPDNTRFEKEAKFTKTWRMRNAGNTDWPADTALVFVSGEKMTEVATVEVGAVKAGENVDISVEMVAPNADGTYRSTWQIQVGATAIQGGGMYTVIIVGEEQAAAPAPVTPIVAPVSGGSFELGGHIRDMGLPYADKMRYAGMTWVKSQIHFGQDGAWKVAAARAQGFKLQLSAIGGPGMVTEPGFEDKYAAWVATLAAAGVDAIEVWNEPNIDREWQIGMISPQSYTNLLCKSYNAIKAANRNTHVISAAPAPTGWFGGCGPNGCDDRPWMEGLYNAGAANCMDYIGAHHNAGATSPSARVGHPANPGDTHHSWFFLPQTELYYNIFRGTCKIVYTEMGFASQEGVETFSDQFAWARGITNAQQAAWLAEAVRLSINTGMVRVLIVWNIDFVRYGYDPQDGFAIIRPGGGCPACDALHGVLGSR